MEQSGVNRGPTRWYKSLGVVSAGQDAEGVQGIKKRKVAMEA